VAGAVAVVGALIAAAFLPAQPPSVAAPDAGEVLERARGLALETGAASLDPVPVRAVAGVEVAVPGSPS
ncbi:MAG TPA: hypothetical protein DCQ30_05415, partial [Acidimicrobiaceae bacterium]|nr:hypothetical protein [Acidimicrobiaceae bacterium]